MLAKCSRWWAPTEPVNQPCCERSPGCIVRRGARSLSRGRGDQVGSAAPGSPRDIAGAEGRRLFSSLTLEENLQVGAHHANKGPFNIDRIYELFEWMPGRRRQRAWQFSGGEQQAIAIGRALWPIPGALVGRALLGLAPIVIERIYALLPEIVARAWGSCWSNRT